MTTITSKFAVALLVASMSLAPLGLEAREAGKPVAAKSSKASNGAKSAKASKAAKTSKAKSTKSAKGKGSQASKKTGKGKAAVAAGASASSASSRTSAPSGIAAPAERRQDRQFNSYSVQFLNGLWRLDPEAAIAAGKFDTAAAQSIPSPEYRAQYLAFIDEWLRKLNAIQPASLSTRQRTDHAILINKLNADRWYLTTFREYEWNPAMHNIAGPMDTLLNTEYASKPQRLRTLLRRLAHAPAFYQAAQASLVNPTREHIQLAISQAPGTITVLADLGQAAQESILTQQEKDLFARRVAEAGNALIGYVDFLTELEKRQQVDGSARPFRIGKALYEAKFGHDIQSGLSAEQTYQKALAAREALLARMDTLSDELWPKHMAGVAKPTDRFRKIGMVIDKLSARHVAREDFLPEIRRQIPQLQDWVTRNNLLSLDEKKPLVVRETPMYQRGVAGASIEAPGPYRPQERTYYNVTPLDGLSAEQAESTLREYNHWILQILNMHEAIPGHYAQLVYANRSPSLVKSLFGNGAMIEGWAVYSERMMMESGYNNEPEMWLMYSKWNLRSVTNTILDYSVHVLGMNEAQAMDLLTRQAFQTQREAAEKWRRVQLTSVQLTSYFSGYNDIMELREQRKQALGERFDLKAFHDQFLSYGSAPVRTIRELMTQ